MRVGVVVFCDVDYGLDLTNTLHEKGLQVSLCLSRKHLVPHLGTAQQPLERMYEVGLVPSDCRVRVFDLPRMRDPRSIGVIRRIAQAMRDDRVDVLHILVGPGELWPAVLGLALRDIPVVSTMIIPKPNVGEGLPAIVPVPPQWPQVWPIWKIP